MSQEVSSAKNERVIIFIDGSNFYHSFKDSFDMHDNEIDFQKLVNILKGDRLLISVHYYNAPLDRGYNEEIYWKQQKFFSELRKIPGFNVILCNMRKIVRPGMKKPEFTVKGDDIYLATDMVSFAYENLYDTAILVSGDGDFVPAINQISTSVFHWWLTMRKCCCSAHTEQQTSSTGYIVMKILSTTSLQDSIPLVFDQWLLRKSSEAWEENRKCIFQDKQVWLSK